MTKKRNQMPLPLNRGITSQREQIVEYIQSIQDSKLELEYRLDCFQTVLDADKGMIQNIQHFLSHTAQ